MTMDPYLGNYNKTQFYLICYMRTHILCIRAKHFVTLSWLDLAIYANLNMTPVASIDAKRSFFTHFYMGVW